MRAFVIGSGKSLNQFDIKKYYGEIIFGAGIIFASDIPVTHYFSMDTLTSIILREESLAYLDKEHVQKGYFKKGYDKYFKHPKANFVDTDEASGITMIKEALKLGYAPIYLLGLDMEYKYPENCQVINNVDEMPISTELKNMLREEKEVNWNDIIIFSETDDIHFNNYYAEHRIPFHLSKIYTKRVRHRFHKFLGGLEDEDFAKIHDCSGNLAI